MELTCTASGTRSMAIGFDWAQPQDFGRHLEGGKAVSNKNTALAERGANEAVERLRRTRKMESLMTEVRPYRLIRERDLPFYAGLKRTQITELIKRGEFPRPIKLSDSGRAKAWLEDELLLWQRERRAKRDID